MSFSNTLHAYALAIVEAEYITYEVDFLIAYRASCLLPFLYCLVHTPKNHSFKSKDSNTRAGKPNKRKASNATTSKRWSLDVARKSVHKKSKNRTKSAM